MTYVLFTTTTCAFATYGDTRRPIVTRPSKRAAPVAHTTAVRGFTQRLVIRIGSMGVLGTKRCCLSGNRPFFARIIVCSSGVHKSTGKGICTCGGPGGTTVLTSPSGCVGPLRTGNVGILLNCLNSRAKTKFTGLAGRRTRSFYGRVVRIKRTTNISNCFLSSR